MSETETFTLDRPRVRYLDASPVNVDGRRLIYLRDPEGMSDQSLAVPVPAYYLMTLFDGEHTVEDLQAAFARQFNGHRVDEAQIRELIRQLDDAYYLDSARFRDHRQAVELEFRAQPARVAAHAGASYPADPSALRAMIDRFFDGVTRHADPGPVEGLIAPHIDFNRGGPCFGASYGALPRIPPDLFVIFGTGHSAKRPFVMSRKDFETPLGLLQADVEVIDAIASRCGFDPFENEISHRGEHSIEFQAVLLRYLYPDADLRFVPILCGSMQPWVQQKASPIRSDVVSRLVDAVRGALDSAGRQVCFVAGVDFSHMGPRFGDTGPLSDAFVKSVEACDRELLACAAEGDPEGFFNVITRECDRTRVCGTSSIYTMLHLLPGRRGKLLRYDQAVDDGRQSLVSFAGMSFGISG